MAEFSFSMLERLQPDVHRVLTNSFQLGRLSHAYLFEGQIGTKKKDTAKLFAMKLLCTSATNDQPCGVCHACRQAEGLKHPNLFWVKPDGDFIKKDQMRRILSEFSKTSIIDKPRIVVIQDAHRMNAESANTMLKFIEEPTAEAYFILITDQLQAMIKTLLSRSQVLHFKPIDHHVIEAELRASGVPERLAVLIPQYTNDLDAAKAIAVDSEMMQIVDLAVTLFIKALARKESLVLLFKSKRDLVIASSERMDFFLTILIVIQKDIYSAKRHKEGIAVDKTDSELVAALARRATLPVIQALLDKMLETKAHLRFNLNVPLAFDNLILHLERGYFHGV
jgi:DNA polymerase III subunit delta'